MGFFIDLFVIIVAIMMILFMLTQVIVPLFSGEPLFPLFRKSAVKGEIVKAEHALEEVAEVTHLKKIISEVNRRMAELEKPE